MLDLPVCFHNCGRPPSRSYWSLVQSGRNFSGNRDNYDPCGGSHPICVANKVSQTTFLNCFSYTNCVRCLGLISRLSAASSSLDFWSCWLSALWPFLFATRSYLSSMLPSAPSYFLVTSFSILNLWWEESTSTPWIRKNTSLQLSISTWMSSIFSCSFSA